jgi:hypothetical protein
MAAGDAQRQPHDRPEPAIPITAALSGILLSSMADARIW